jgi:uncharacterized SAM-binding protein YcdF (DUF218 family)
MGVHLAERAGITAALKQGADTKSPSWLGKLPPIVTRKERWGLSRTGWVLLFIGGGLSVYFVWLTIYPFLAVTHRVEKGELVMEGWVHPYAIATTVKEFESGGYERVFSTGGPVTGSGGYINDQNTSASVGAGGLRAAGIPNELIHMVPSHMNDRDRTYGSAVALRQWFRDRNAEVRSINVVTETTHARRTRFLFQKAFGSGVAVGVIAVRNPDYDPKYWWSCSEGVRDVIDEGVAYIYAKLFFYPSPAPDHENAAESSQAPR